MTKILFITTDEQRFDALGCTGNNNTKTPNLDKIASGSNDGPVFEGWRYDIFGKNALLLCEGKIGLAADGNKIKIVQVN